MAEFRVVRLGCERQPVVIVDNFSANPEVLLDEAQTRVFGAAGRHYPGVRAGADAGYLSEQMPLLQQILTDIFDMPNGAHLIECNYSLVSTKQDDLTPIQRLPHFDGVGTGCLALLHFLRGPEFGGTSFYRHRATGFETITGDRLSDYEQCLRHEFDEIGPPEPKYFGGSSKQFELLKTIPAAINRMIIYRGIMLHSGQILNTEVLTDDPKCARLTINTFLQAR